MLKSEAFFLKKISSWHHVYKLVASCVVKHDSIPCSSHNVEIWGFFFVRIQWVYATRNCSEYVSHEFIGWVTNLLYTSRTYHMSHELSVDGGRKHKSCSEYVSHTLILWGTNLLCESRTYDMSCELILWVTNLFYESKYLQKKFVNSAFWGRIFHLYNEYMSHELIVWVTKLLHESRTYDMKLSYESRTYSASHELIVWVMDLSHESQTNLQMESEFSIYVVSHELITWVTNLSYESRTYYMSHEQSADGGRKCM